MTPKTSRRILTIAALVPSLAAVTLTAVHSFGSADEPRPEHSVRLIIDYGDGVQKHFTALHWKKDMTVLDAMNLAKASPHGITFQHTGSGSSAFLTKIDDLQNEGGGHKNWLYWVNTTLAKKSFGAYKLEPSDVVLWKFSPQKL